MMASMLRASSRELPSATLTQPRSASISPSTLSVLPLLLQPFPVARRQRTEGAVPSCRAMAASTCARTDAPCCS